MSASFDSKFIKFAKSTSSILTGLISYWKLNETSGTIVTDAVGTLDLASANVTVNQTGKIGQAYSFNGTTSYAGVTTDIYEFTTAMSVSCWISPTSAAAYQGLVSDYYAPDDSGWELTIEYQDKPTFAVRSPGQVPANASANGTTVLGTGTWYYLVGTFDGTYARLYVNGTLQATSSAWAHPITYHASARPSIGRRYDTLYYSGLIDEVGVWNRVLNQTEITALYNSGAGITHPF